MIPHILGTVKHQSCTYCKGHFIMLSYDNTMAPKFGKVVDIIIRNEVIVFSLEVYVKNHYNAYCINPLTECFCGCIQILHRDHCLNCHVIFSILWLSSHFVCVLRCLQILELLQNVA